MRECFVVTPRDLPRINPISGKAFYYLTDGYAGKCKVCSFGGKRSNILRGYGDDFIRGLSGKYIELEDKYFCCIELPTFYK
jgi:hypothetical protein